MNRVHNATIFVSIASYRDRECAATIADLFAKAAHPERLALGVLWQIDRDRDGSAYTQILCRAEQVRGEVVAASRSRGPCWARHWIQSRFYAGEDFYLQIDSHMRFEAAWDVTLLQMWHNCPAHKPVLSTLPPPYNPPDERIATGLPFIRAERFKSDGNLVQRSGTLDPAMQLSSPRPSAFLSAAFIFAEKSMLSEVPYDPYLYFYGEELTLAVRLWTHGYDFFVPNQIVVYHNYGLQERARHWDDHPGEWWRLQQLSQQRRLHLLGMEPSSDPSVIQEMDSYSLGNERSVAEYERYADIDLNRRKIGVRALDGRFPAPDLLSDEERESRKIFTDIYQAGRWGGVESRSGSRSLWRKTKHWREHLQQLVHRWTIRTLLDAGCGDGNWLAWMDEALLDLYLGVDCVAELISNNQQLFAQHAHYYFKVADLTRDPLPCMDAILCRHVLSWLSLQQAREVLVQCKKSGSRYLLATTYPGASNRANVTGQWRRLDLTRPPFSLPAPLQLLADGTEEEGCFMGVWRLADCTLTSLTVPVWSASATELLFAPLREEWQLWQEAGRRCQLWWRDDDLTAPSANYQRLQDLAEEYALPVLLAVIPVRASERLLAANVQSRQLFFCQHGYAHTNHHPAGKGQSEFALERAEEEVAQELQQGMRRLQQLFAESFLPVFVPPWNNYPEERIFLLQRAGFIGLSQYGVLPTTLQEKGGVRRYNAHLDLMDWTQDPPRIQRRDWLLERLLHKLRQRRLGEVDLREPLGILTHHRIMDRQGWLFLQQLFAVSRSFSAVEWLSPRQLFREGEENKCAIL
ncbi:GlcNAc-transferase family protein [Candidatus Magnetaquicoccus inordinatus]|uniref:GlcNAc-transferase family protein n=1 Tax=Candidatus Magnetaquicoccus inordinatus TaxID=2496818 RepID=UPI00102B1B99|nr:GlcNAc-transferase family protein [Candidatus Magnetaquicoccus inordinatus]